MTEGKAASVKQLRRIEFQGSLKFDCSICCYTQRGWPVSLEPITKKNECNEKRTVVVVFPFDDSI